MASSSSLSESQPERQEMVTPLGLWANKNIDSANPSRVALIILNSPISNPPSPIFERLWSLASYRICADGGANRLYHATTATTENAENKYMPNLIKGDLDSLKPDVRSYYADHNVDIVQDPCQDTNDLDKAMQSCFDKEKSSLFDMVVIYGGFGGRFDQEMASFQALYKWAPMVNHRLWIYSDQTCAVLIPSPSVWGLHLPCHDETLPEGDGIGEGPTCGLIPLGGKCDAITTTGLKWDLDQTPSEFGGLVSTSNRVMKSTITIQTSHPLIFTAEVLIGGQNIY